MWYNTLQVKTNQKKSRGLRWWLTTAIVVVAVAIAALAIALPFALIYAPLPEIDFDASPYLKGTTAKLVSRKKVTAKLNVQHGDGFGLRIGASGMLLDWPFTAKAVVKFGFIRASGDFLFSLDKTDWRLSGTFSVRSATHWRFSAVVPEAKFSSDDDVVGHVLSNLKLSSVSNIVCSGAFSLSARGESTPRRPLASWSVRGELKGVDAALSTGKSLVKANNLRLKFGASGLADRTEVSPMFPRADSIEAAGVVLSNVFASVRAAEQSYLVTEAGAECAGGELKLYSLFLNPKSLSAGATIYVDGVDAGNVLSHVASFRGEATGRLHGKFPFFLKNGSELRLRDAYLFSTPGETGNVRVLDASPILDNLALGGVPDDDRANLAKALANLDYTVLRVMLHRDEDGDGSSLSLMLKGSATSGKTTVPVNLNVTFRGDIDQLIDTGMKFRRRYRK